MRIIKLFIGILSVAWPLLTLAETQPPRAELQGSPRDARVSGARLVNSRKSSAGYLEVEVDGKWYYACGDKFGLADAKVTCKQLGFEDGKLKRVDLLPQSAVIELEPKCTGLESSLSQCAAVVSDTCTSKNMIAVFCSNINVVQNVRFANSSSTATYGIVEYFVEGSWTLVCDDSYSYLSTAKVACKQLGFSNGIFQPDSALGIRSDQSKLGVTIDCKGDESRLSQCPTILNEQCISKNYLTLVCSRTVKVEKVKLTNSISDNYGIFEVYAEGSWMAVCDFDYSFNLAKVTTVAKVACKQLGFHDGEFQPGSALGLKPDLKKFIVDMNCQGDEKNLGECRTTISDFCVSNNYTTLTCIQTVNVTDVRLTNNEGILNYGILKYKIGDSWTAVCDNYFDLKIAKLACKQLGFVDGNYQPGSAIGKLAQVDITSVDMDCSGNPQLLSQCKTTVSDYCLNENYITLYCSREPIIPKEQIEVRIPSKLNFGLVEANLFGFWGPICDKGWTDQNANTLCLQLNYKGGYAYYATTDSKEPMVLGGFNCSEYDKNLDECSHKEFGVSLGCQYPQSMTRRAAGVFCYGDNDGIHFKLSDRWYGRVQVNYDKKWGRVCNRNWGHKEASILCKQLRYEDGVPDYTDSTPGSGEVKINNVNCTGSETSILECSHQPGWVQPIGDCPGDAQVICKRKICGSIDIRNSVENLKRLERCTVIEGNLTILLIDSNSWEDYQQYSFPNLVEITEYLVLFRVSKLKSLNTLFPNLAIIRGDKLFSDYALVAFEMPDLLELGLSSLVSIPRGAVRLEKNPNLCYIETVDWSRITTGVALSENYFKDNKDVQECVNRCPTDCGKTPDNDISTLRRSLDNDQAVLRCWTISHCQKMLDKPSICHQFYTLDDKKTCCDPNCIAGCTGPSPQQCTACKDIMQYTGHRNLPTCTQQCTPATYMYKRRCLLAKDCRNFNDYRLGMTIDLKLTESEDVNLKPGLCMTDCPSGYNVDPVDKQKCVKCKGRCPKICTGKVIDSVHAAQELKDCNIIKGPLSIKLMQGGQIAEELEANLADIEEITEFIMISHSEALMSLHFFKNLRRIGGERLLYDKYVFYAYDNLNLQELFPEGLAKNLTLGNGSVLFQYNRKLCYNKISQFITDVGRNISLISSEEISNENNGDQMPCQMQTLILKLIKVSPHIAFVRWTRMNISDDRHLIGYSINWKVSPEMNASIYKGVDACTDDLWESKDVCTDDKCETAFGFIAGLEPWTQYAAYIRALTVSKAVQGAISDIMYFRTGPEVPTSPINLQVIAKVPGQLVVTWDPPKRPNGNVTHYQVYWQRRDFIKDEYQMRNYCTNPLLLSTPDRDKELKEEEEKKKNGTINGECCACPQTDKEKKVEDRERNLDIQFQDFLQNQIYVKRVETAATTYAPSLRVRSRRAKRDIPADPHEVNKYTYKSQIGNGNPTLIMSTVTPDGNHTDLNMTDANGTAITTTPSSEDQKSKPEKKKDNPFYMADVYVERKFIIANLGHFEDYNIEVIACHTRPSDSKDDMLCSNQALGFGRTLPDLKADTINASLVEVKHLANKTGAVHITWHDPTNPNGVILTYDIEYMNTNIRNVKPILICITYEMYRDIGKGHILDKLDPGNYTFKLRATSLAGNGSWTEPLSFNIQDHTPKELQPVTMIGIIVSGVVVIIFITVVLLCFIAKKWFWNKLPPGMLVSTNPDYMPDYEAYVPDEWEVDRDNVELIKELGQGSFGMVYEGIVKNLTPGQDRIPVAVKTTNKQSTDHDRYQFLQEASIMKQFNCYHVVKLIGVVSRDQPAYVLMELMPNGDLKNFLRLHRPDEEDNNGRTPPTLKQILQIAGEIADGMAYLADKKYVHRDLAARNCMVGADMTVKIGDFGMTRDIYETDYYRKGSRGLLPVRWMAPESLKDGVFTSLTDVWSYGVVLWEMATLAAQPYQGLSNEEVLRYVGSGKIMDTPERCPTRLYDLMVKCWRYRPKQRPTFKEIIELLLPDLDKKFKEVSYFFSEENAKYEESKQTSATNNHEEPLEDVDEYDRPMNDYVDESHLPMLGAGASNGHSVELQDIFTDSGSYPHYSSSHNKQHVGSAEMCDCSFREQAGAAAQSLEFNRQSVCSSPNSAIGGSSDGSKDSSKSSSSSYAHMNGLSVANGHVPVHMRTTPC